MKLKEPRSFSSSFIIFFLSFFFFLSFCSSEPLATQCTYSTSPPILKQWSDDNLMEWVHKTFINSLDSILEFKGASPCERLRPTEEEKGQAGRPKGVEPAGLLSVGLHFFGFFLLRTLWCFPSLCFTEICSWFHCFAVEIIIHTQYIGFGQGGVSQKDVFG